MDSTADYLLYPSQPECWLDQIQAHRRSLTEEASGAVFMRQHPVFACVWLIMLPCAWGERCVRNAIQHLRLWRWQGERERRGNVRDGREEPREETLARCPFPRDCQVNDWRVCEHIGCCYLHLIHHCWRECSLSASAAYNTGQWSARGIYGRMRACVYGCFFGLCGLEEETLLKRTF